MNVATVALAAGVLAMAAMIGGVFEVRRLRRAGVPRNAVKHVQVAIGVLGLVGVVSLLVWTWEQPPPSGPNSENVSVQLVAQLSGQVILTALAISFIWWRIRKIRRMTEVRGEPILTRRAELAVQAEPALTLQWATRAIRDVEAYGVEVDPEYRHISATTPGRWNEVSLCVNADVDDTGQGNSVLHVTAWPKNSEMASHDLGAVQYFVDELVKDVRRISENPPERETPTTVMRQVLTQVEGMPELKPSIRARAKAASEILDAGRLSEAETLTNEVIDAIRFTYAPGDPARRVAQINLGRKIRELGGIATTDIQA